MSPGLQAEAATHTQVSAVRAESGGGVALGTAGGGAAEGGGPPCHHHVVIKQNIRTVPAWHTGLPQGPSCGLWRLSRRGLAAWCRRPRRP